MAAAAKVALHAENTQIDCEKWFLRHPKYTEILSHGFEDKLQLQIALLTYLDLCEAKNWWNVEIHPCHKLGMVYISGKQNKKSEVQLVLPISASTPLSNKRLQEFTANIKLEDLEAGKPHEQETEVNPEVKGHCVVLAVHDSDSTIVYYRISDGLIPPDPPKQTLVQEVGKGKRKKRKAVFVAREPDEPVTDEDNWDDEL